MTLTFAFAALCPKFPSPSYQVPSSDVNSPHCSFPWPPQVKLIHLTFLQCYMYISIPARVTLYYSYFPSCLLSELDHELPKIRDFTFHLYVINVESAWRMAQIFMELVRNNRLGAQISSEPCWIYKVIEIDIQVMNGRKQWYRTISIFKHIE